MNNTVSTAIAINAQVQANMAQQEAEAARRTACTAAMSVFNPHGASVQEMQAYAECVDLVYPKTTSAADVLLVKATIVCTILGMVIGGFTGWLDDCEPIAGMFLLGLIGGLLGSVTPIAFAGTWRALQFLFS